MKLALYRYSLAFRQPLMFKGNRLANREGLLVCINGQWGEIAPLPGFSTETLADVEAETLACLETMQHGEKVTPTLPSVQFGFDCAQRQWPANLPAPLPPYPLLQGAPRELMLVLDNVVNGWGALPPSRLKLKVARYTMAEELALINQLAIRLPSTKLILDANGGWTREEAQRFCTRLPLKQIDYLEEPCAAFADTIAVAEATGVSIALDETLSRQKEWHYHPQLKALVIKPTLIGSLSACEALVQRARERDLQVVISSSFESDLGLELLARLACEWAPDEPPGLDTGHWLSERVTTAAGEVMTENLHCLSKMENSA
ncbi:MULTISPECIES: o-succinylbenzoate synthase [unclassified Halomonas]|uniref:o-succinylbenzoate synthase n=1 Tax=unclassified Halomonas TaxID=2609666 RepID=UPI0007D9D009|nr:MULTISPECIES: o-succinylbenzoate synthase [unclassified Halomonas]MBT2786211.1 o-succinylbenzoate synthase [Halomonas sp. ISL-106]MBT2797233.1 o-succinylbenzoate synthase [Halomonas sp. ISL-104]OAL58609.1 o-succinylbenzoate synthase [Halomonas sp. ALS9]